VNCKKASSASTNQETAEINRAIDKDQNNTTAKAKETTILEQTRYFGGAKEITNDEGIKSSILEYGIPYIDWEIRHIYKTCFTNPDGALYIVLLKGIHEGDDGWGVTFYTIKGDKVIKRSSLTLLTMFYYEWYDGLRYKSKIPGDWVECGFIGDFNSDGKMELALFLAWGIGFFMHVYEYDSENDTFIKTFEEELNLGYKEMVQYGEAKGTKGFFLNNDILNPWHKKRFYGWDPDQRKYVYKASYLEGEEQ
jgi:hypothetical protein